MAIELKGRQFQALVDALGAAFPDYNRLRLFTRVYLNKPLAQLAAPGPLPDVLYALVEWAEANGAIDDLVTGALEDMPNSPRLKALGPELVLTSAGTPSERLQSIVLKSVPMPDVVGWRGEMARLEDSVCRLETDAGQPAGSGFLIGDDLVLTNRHVADQLSGTAAARFAYKRTEAGGTGDGERVGFAADWVAGSSAVGDLDYAAIRLARAPERPHLPPPLPYAFTAGDIYLILHHPVGTPLKISAGTLSGADADGRRIRYTVNTEPGSSGSPVFTLGWQPVALHRAGGTVANSGVPLRAIAGDAAGAQLWR